MILWAVVAHGLNLHFTLQVEVNGTVVGSVATEQNFDTARADLQARLAAARQLADSSDTAALPVLEPTYTLHIGGTPMTELQLTDAILRASGSSIVEGTAVYLDGSLAFVTVEGDHLRCLLTSCSGPGAPPGKAMCAPHFCTSSGWWMASTWPGRSALWRDRSAAAKPRSAAGQNCVHPRVSGADPL